MEWTAEVWEWVQDQRWSASVAAWVEAIGTGGAFLIAATVYAGTVRDKRREQANRISAWVSPDGGPDDGARKLNLLNESDQPVFGLRVTAREDQGIAEPLVWGMLPPKGHQGSHEEIPVDPHVGGPEYRLPSPVDLVFVDAEDREWHRLGQRHRLRRHRWWHRHPWRHGKRRDRKRRQTRETAGPE